MSLMMCARRALVAGLAQARSRASDRTQTNRPGVLQFFSAMFEASPRIVDCGLATLTEGKRSLVITPCVPVFRIHDAQGVRYRWLDWSATHHMRHSSLARRQLFVFLFLLCAILLPVGGMTLAALLSPPPYRLTAVPDAAWANGQSLPGGGRARVRTLADEESARAAARAMLASIQASSSSTVGSLSRYRAGGERGFILAIDRYVVSAMAPDEASLDRAVAALPFLVSNEEAGGFAALLDRHLLWFCIGVLIYALLLVLVLSRLLGWAARRSPLPDSQVLSSAALCARLLALEFPGVTVDADEGNELVLRYAGGDIVERLTLRLDADDRVVRAVSSGTRGRLFEGQSIGFFKSWWRTLPSGPSSERVSQVVQSSGWTLQPVFTFVRVVGG